VSITPIADFNGDRIVNLLDFSKLAQHWLQNESSVDIAPAPVGDGKIDYKDLTVLSEHWLETETIYIQWLGHSSVKVWAGDVVIYIDPRNLSTSPHDANAVLVTHSHSDHYQPADIAKVSGPTTKFIAPPDVVKLYGKGQAIAPGQTIQFDGFSVTGVPAYNTNHPKSNNWLGFIIELASKRIYIAGDTDLIDEMKSLGHIDVAFLPAGGTYTMNAQQAAEATKYIKPQLAIPYHWGQIVGTLADAQRFANLAACNVKIMSAGEIISSQDWLKDFSLIANWKLDETAGVIAYDSAGVKNGTLNGNPTWQPTNGKIDGALLLDGAGDYVSTPFVLNPASGPFSVFAWIKGGAPGQVILSQIGGVSWLSADTSAGNLMTELKPSSGRFGQALTSQTVITDGNWHRIGFVWDSSYRTLYVDDVVAAKDTAAQGSLGGSTSGLYIGADKSLNAASFWTGLVDDVRIHNRAVTP
jgi:L-ascorbate metabolism protein UlaG (beta-lactamase superfamily)